MIDSTGLEYYVDPVLYDLESGPTSKNAPYYLEMARQAAGPVLELGCGTGRVTIPLAEQGIDITGLDAVPQMLTHARLKANGLPIRWVCADMRTFHLDTRYLLIIVGGGVFSHLLTRTDQEALFARVHEHLAAGGRFVVDFGWRRPDQMINVLEEQAWHSFVDQNGRTVHISGTERYDHIRQIWYQTLYYRWHKADGEEITRQVTLALRYMMLQEMEALLHYNDFRVLSHSQVTEDSEGVIYICDRRP
jgi:SAM-dependent methyltransferase